MKRMLIVANHQSVRIYRPGRTFCAGHLDFGNDAPAMPKRGWNAHSVSNLDARIGEMADYINRILTQEAPDSWAIAAPFGLVTDLLSRIEESVASKLDDARIGDLTALPSPQLEGLFPSNRAA